MAPVIVDPKAVHAFPDWRQFEAWLAQNHASAPELWLKIYKKGSGQPTITAPEAVEVALCWGWIDGIRKSLDESAFLQRYTPRRAKSIWSQVNRDLVAKLVAAGRMTPHGLAQVEAAKADGRWDAAYGRSADMPVPPDLVAAIAADPAAQAVFATLTQQNRFALAFRLHAIKTPAGRARKIAAFVAMLARGETPYPQRRDLA